jgi:hypothetical protein
MPVNLPTTFPFYSRANDPTHRRHYCSAVSIFVQPVPVARIPQFVLKNPGTITKVWAHNIDKDWWIDILPLLNTNTATVDGDVFFYTSWTDINQATQSAVFLDMGVTPKGGSGLTWPSFTIGCQKIELVIEAGANTWYSELFYVKPDLEVGSSFDPSDQTGCIFLEFADDVKVGEIPYSDIIFAQRVHLPCDVHPPQYEIKEEGDEDGQRVFHPVFRSVTKRYEFRILVPEYMSDALATSAIHRTVILTDQTAQTGTVFDMQIETDWEADGCQCLLTYTFRRSVTHKVNC